MSYIGNNKIGGMHLGTTKIGKAYLGSDLVYSGETLPYDAKVEYLGCTGTQYIDTGIAPLPTDEISGKFGISSSSIAGTILGCISRDDNGICALVGQMFGTTAVRIYAGFFFTGGAPEYRIYTAPPVTFSVAYSAGVRHVYDASGNEISVVDDTSVAGSSTNYHNLEIFQRGGKANSIATDARCYNLKIVRGGNTILDLIPVRIGQVGYMYDKVSGQLIANAGSGNFILGNDI